MTKGKGFAGMSREKALAIAKKGGRSVPPESRAFSTNRDLAVEAGRKGGRALHRNYAEALAELRRRDRDS